METNLSANTLFHFTNDKKNLLSIFENSFYVRYSLENFEGLVNMPEPEIVLPMVSFCDIPLSQVKRHTQTYGRYAIGLTKDWGMRNNISPVTYTFPGSTTSKILNDIISGLDSFLDIKPEIMEDKIEKFKKKEIGLFEFLNDPTLKYRRSLSKDVEEMKERMNHFIKFIKPYEGKFYRDNNYLDSQVRFYDEREWRYTPPKKLLKEKEIKDSYVADYYKNPIKRRAINIKIAKHFKLEFKASDIRFIIVQKEKEIPEILEKIEKIFGGNTTHKDLKLLGTRLISLEQIIEDI